MVKIFQWEIDKVAFICASSLMDTDLNKPKKSEEEKNKMFEEIFF